MNCRRFDKRYPSVRIVVPALAAIVFSLGSARADTIVDLTTRGSSDTVNGAVFSQVDPHPTGTGYIDSFVRVQNKGVESGFNTDGKPQLDTKAGAFTHSIQLKDIPEVTIGGTTYREFYLDINETLPGTLLSLDSVQISLANSGSLTNANNLGTKVWDLDATGNNWIKLNYDLNSGSGGGDMRMLIPTSVFGNDDNKYVYLYSKFGVNESADAGFEEWWVKQGSTSQPVPEPSALALAVIGGGAFVGFLQRKKRRAAA